MLHLTVNTGHVRRSPRSEVSDEVVAALRRLIDDGGGAIPSGSGYGVQITREGRNAAFTVNDSLGAPVLTGVLATERPETAWSGLAALIPTLEMAMPGELPWLAVLVHRGNPSDLFWLADFERCLAWALIEAGSG